MSDGYRGVLFNPRPYQKEALRSIWKQWEQGGIKKLLTVLPTGCHDPNQEILMFDGSIKKARDVCLGDKLMGMDSTPRTVLYKQSGSKRMFRIIPTKGDPFVVTEDHQLTLERTRETSNPQYPCETRFGDIVDVSVSEWITWSKWRKHIHKLKRCGVDFPSIEMPTLDPYVAGLLIGDGSFRHNLSFTNMDAVATNAVRKELEKFDLILEKANVNCGKATCWLIRTAKKNQHNRSKFRRTVLAPLGLNFSLGYEKHIPIQYKVNTRNARLLMLAGLMDSDGHCTCGGYDFISISKQLSNDVAFIARSLGLAAYVKKSIKSSQSGATGEYWRVSISGDCSIIPCKIKRKIAQPRTQKKSVLRTGFTAESIGDGEYVGFTVDGDNRYLMGDFTVTHNCGKTILFSMLANHVVKNEGRKMLILAHRDELIQQARDKLERSTGLESAIEKAAETGIGSFHNVVVASVQSLCRINRLHMYPADFFDYIVVDETHRILADTYQRILNYFESARVLGVTATPARGDKKSLGKFFDAIAYEYRLHEAIDDGWLSPIRARTCPLDIDISQCKMSAGDYQLGDLAASIEPYLEAVADEMVKFCMDRKTLLFLPLVQTSKMMAEILTNKGIECGHVDGSFAKTNRSEAIDWFANAPRGTALCNSMLLTEGYDQADIDCVVVLRPTKSTGLYAQMVGRGTRVVDESINDPSHDACARKDIIARSSKPNLLLLDFLWNTANHKLCTPASLIAKNDDMQERMDKVAKGGGEIDLHDLEDQITTQISNEREAKLARLIEASKGRRSLEVDPVIQSLSLFNDAIVDWEPEMAWEKQPMTEGQIGVLQKNKIPCDGWTRGFASQVIDAIIKRGKDNLCTINQMRALMNAGVADAHKMSFDEANKHMERLSAQWAYTKNNRRRR